MERWLPIKDFPMYEVSSNGRVRNIKTGRILRPQSNTNGYLTLTLRNDKGQSTKRIHRLVADAFYDGVHENLDVNHIDGNKHNNFIGNLEFCTRQSNIQHAFRTGLKKPSRSKRIRIIETGDIYDSIRECARAIGGDPTSVRRVLTRVESHCKGFHFELID